MRNILIIDDQTEIRENITEILTLAGYNALNAENGKRGIEVALANKPDLIVCDIMMPELDGYGVLHMLRKNPTTENTPFIFLTAKTERNDFRKGMEMGADDFITKPFDDIELLKAIEVRLKKLDVLNKGYEATGQGINSLLRDLKGTGFMNMQMDQYEHVTFHKRQQMYTEGKRPKSLFYIKKGRIKTFKTNEDGKEYITNLYSDGDFIGYHALLENSVYDDNAEVLDETEIVIIPKDEFLTAIFNDLTIAHKFIKLISLNVKDQEERLMQLAYSSLRKRVAKALIDISAKLKVGNNNSPIAISRDDIAHYVGTATESLIRTLSDFKSERLIEIREGKIRIENFDKLKNLLY
ncbi:response regulator [Pinibacter aurantiacus]|uniref:Response regulator n=1 Tax=Pinibacter aurantiacus TaxID=2851599 RepID=A0A9E2SC51_9BACT|nr:response regulator [Pinibacter aurantiacus]MBV4360276.1 response regulator [Pinibacter aurantiacus]